MTEKDRNLQMLSEIFAKKKVALFSDEPWEKERNVEISALPLRFAGDVKKILIVTDKKNIQTWMETWDEAGKLLITVDGTKEQRIQKLAAPAGVGHIISKSLLEWFIETEYAFAFDMIVVDGTPGRKSKSWQVLAEICANARRVVILDDVPNLENLWERVYLLDGGERLESKDFREYRDRHFQPWKTQDGVVWDWMPLRGADRWIYGKIKDVCTRVPRATQEEGGEVHDEG